MNDDDDDIRHLSVERYFWRRLPEKAYKVNGVDGELKTTKADRGRLKMAGRNSYISGWIFMLLVVRLVFTCHIN